MAQYQNFYYLNQIEIYITSHPFLVDSSGLFTNIFNLITQICSVPNGAKNHNKTLTVLMSLDLSNVKIVPAYVDNCRQVTVDGENKCISISHTEYRVRT